MKDFNIGRSVRYVTQRALAANKLLPATAWLMRFSAPSVFSVEIGRNS